MERIIIYTDIYYYMYTEHIRQIDIYIRRDVETEIENKKRERIIKVRYNKKVFIENNNTGIKNYPVSVNKVIS